MHTEFRFNERFTWRIEQKGGERALPWMLPVTPCQRDPSSLLMSESRTKRAHTFQLLG